MPKISALPASSGVSQGTVLPLVANTVPPLVTRQATVAQINALTFDLEFGLVNGANNDVNLLLTTNPRGVKLQAGPTAAFSITGIVSSSNGRQLSIWNDTGQALTITNESASSSAANRITTLTGANVVFLAAGILHLIYDAGSSRWIVIGKHN